MVGEHVNVSKSDCDDGEVVEVDEMVVVAVAVVASL